MVNNSETIYFQRGDVLVSNARFVNGNQTFAIRNVSSVRRNTTDGALVGPIVLFLLGILAFASSPGFGVAMIAFGVGWYVKKKPMHQVVLSASGSEQTGLESRDSNLIDEVVAAITKAIIDRA